MIIHFVYAGEPNNTITSAPYSITRNVYNFLSTKAEVVYHQWDATYDIDLRSDDILIGHPHYDPNTVVQKAMRRDCRAKCLFHPFHHRRVEDNFPFDPLVKLANKLFMICGPYWIDTIATTPFAHWAEKIVRLDMAIDTSYFYFRRGFEWGRFNEVGQRKLLYVGSNMPQKNLDLLYEMMVLMPDIHLFWYGTGDHRLRLLPNVTAYGFKGLTSDLLDELVTKADVFVNVSVSDASPTALLEAAAIGFPVACTPESGIYDSEMVTLLKLDDVAYNVSAIKQLLNSDQLMSKATKARQLIEERHTWDRFCARLWDGISKI